MNIFKKYKNWLRSRHIFNTLSKLSDEELKDIGISRSDILSISRNQP